MCALSNIVHRSALQIAVAHPLRPALSQRGESALKQRSNRAFKQRSGSANSRALICPIALPLRYMRTNRRYRARVRLADLEKSY